VNNMESLESIRQQLEQERAARKEAEERLSEKERALDDAYRIIRSLQATTPMSAKEDTDPIWKLALEGSGDGVWEHNTQTGETVYSHQFKKLLGYGEDEAFTVATRVESIHPDDMEKVQQAFDNYIAGKTSRFLYEHRVRCRDGSYKYFLNRAVAVEWTPDGKPLRLVGTMLDIHQQKLMALELKDTANRLSVLISSLHAGVVVENENQQIVLANDIFCSLFHLDTPAEQLMGASYIDWAVKHAQLLKDPNAFIESTHRLLEERKFSEGEYLELVDGRILERIYIPVYIGQEYRGHLWKYANVTENLQAQRQLQINEKRYRDLYNYSHALICTHDARGILLGVNPAISKLLGYATEELIGKSLTALLPPNDVERFLPDYLEKVLREGEAKGIFRVVSKDGRLLYLLYQNYKVEEEGAEPYIIGFSQDITERIKSERELRLAQRMTENLARAKEIFLANMSHEIRTPLNGILGIATLLAKTELDPEQQKYLGLITDSANNLLVIVNDILEIEKIASGKFEFEQIPFRVAEKIITTVQPFQYKAEERNVRLELRNELPDGLVVEGDPHRLAQVLNNFLSNALKFTEKGTVTVSAKLSAETETGVTIEFAVADTGIGIHPDRIAEIFDPFVQASSDTARKYGGTGLGLSICKSMIELQEGSVRVESVLEEGSVFTFTIPYKKGDMPNPTEQPREDQGLQRLEGKRMLVAEDVPVNQFFLKHILESWGAQVDVVGNGRDAVARVKEQSYDLVLMDIQMPEMDGTEATAAIRQLDDKQKAAVLIIALTANALKGDNQRYLDAGMDGYVSKPYTAEKLNKVISALLQEKDAETEELPQEESQSESLYDLTMIRSVSNGNEAFVREIVQLFLETTPDDLAQLLEAGRREAWEQLARVAHKMKSSVENMGIHALVPAIRRLEHNASHHENLQEVPLLLAKVNDILGEALRQLKSELQPAATSGA
jgi:PAS domain S-box-containing protein